MSHNKGTYFDWESPNEISQLDFSSFELDNSAWIHGFSVYAISWRLSLVFPILPGPIGIGLPWPLDICTILGVGTGVVSAGMDIWSGWKLISELFLHL